MGPADFLAMWKGYEWREEKRHNERLTDLYLLRLIATATHNALVDKRSEARTPSDILPIPEIDDPKADAADREQQKKKLKDALKDA